MAALIQSFFTAWIVTKTDPSKNPLNEVGAGGIVGIPKTNPRADNISDDKNEYEMGPGIEKAGGIDPATGYRLSQPYLVNRLAEIVHEPLPPHTKRPTQGSLDPLKEAKAAVLQIQHALKTHEQVTRETGGGLSRPPVHRLALHDLPVHGQLRVLAVRHLHNRLQRG
mgnify:CR=1 FL=1